MTERARRWSRLSLGLTTTVFFGWLLARELDGDQVAAALSALSVPTLALAVVFLAAGYMTRILRWWLMLRPLQESLAFSVCVRPFLVSIAINNVVPLRAGDLLRVFGFRSQLKLGSPQLFGSLIIERLLDLFVLTALFSIGALLLPGDALPKSLDTVLSWLAAIAAVAALAFAVAVLIYSTRDRTPVTSLLAGRAGRDNHWRRVVVQALAVSLHLRSVKQLLSMLLLSFSAWLLEGAVFVLVADVMIAQANYFAPWFALAGGTLATLMPSAPGHLGTFDYFAAQAMVAYGVTAGSAAAFAVVVHAILWLPLTVVGLLLLVFGDHPLQRIKASRAAVRQQE